MQLDEFVQSLVDSGLMKADEVEAFRSGLSGRPDDPKELARLLVKAGKITRYQAQAVYQGKTKGLNFNQYVVIDRIGAGGMGTVLKARHRHMGRVVALKILPPTANMAKSAVERFQREVKAAARLAHPNIVTALDADICDGVHFLVMEFVDGQDLSTLAKESGPFSVHQAVDYIAAGRARGSNTPTRRAWCTATSSRPTCCSTPPAWSRFSTWGWPGSRKGCGGTADGAA